MERSRGLENQNIEVSGERTRRGKGQNKRTSNRVRGGRAGAYVARPSVAETSVCARALSPTQRKRIIIIHTTVGTYIP